MTNFRFYLLLILTSSISFLSCKKTNDGVNGKDGINSLVRTSSLAPGDICNNGGTRIETGLDANQNGILENSEVIPAQTQNICNNSTPVIYSQWIDVVSLTASQGGWKDTTITGTYHRRAILFTPFITQAIYDKGTILVFMEDNYSSHRPVITQLPYKIVFETDDYDDFKAYFGVGKITLTWQVVVGGKIIPFTDFSPDVRFRYVIIPEGTALPANGGRPIQQQSLRTMKYDDIIKEYSIPKEGRNM